MGRLDGHFGVRFWLILLMVFEFRISGKEEAPWRARLSLFVLGEFCIRPVLVGGCSSQLAHGYVPKKGAYSVYF